MREIDTEVIVKSVKDMIGEACFTLADGVMDALKAAEKAKRYPQVRLRSVQ